MWLRERLLPHLSFGKGASGVPPPYLGTFCKGAVGSGGVPAGIWQAPHNEMKRNGGEY